MRSITRILAIGIASLALSVSAEPVQLKGHYKSDLGGAFSIFIEDGKCFVLDASGTKIERECFMNGSLLYVGNIAPDNLDYWLVLAAYDDHLEPIYWKDKKSEQEYFREMFESIRPQSNLLKQ